MRYTLLLLIINSVIITVHGEPFLFKRFPCLKSQIPYISFCDLPTPIIRLENFGNYIGCKNIWMKQDDLSGKDMGNGAHLYGGNKPRKLEFLLADALKNKAQTIITHGCAGSNHALATAVYADYLGLKSILMLKDQPNSDVVQNNLLLDKYYNAQLKFFPNNSARMRETQVILESDPSVYFIPTGGSNAIGVLGFVNAAFELVHQIKNKELIEPDYIYVATGSCATTAGLLLGLQVAQLKSQVIAVCVEPEEELDKVLLAIKELFIQANEMLHVIDTSFPVVKFPETGLILNKKFMGTAYGALMPQTATAVSVFNDLQSVKLEATYSAKPIAAIMDDAACGRLQDKTVLFWNTYCGLDYSYLINMHNYKTLPLEFYSYFL